MKNTLLVLTILLSSFLFSQKATIKQGPEFKSDDGKFDSYISNDANGIYVLRYKQKATTVAYFIQKIDPKTLLPVYTTPYEGNTSQMYLVGDKFLAFSSTYDKKEQIKYFLLNEYDVKTGKKIGEQKQISALKTDVWGVNGRNFYVTFSPNKSKMAVINEFKWPKKASEVDATIYETNGYKKLGVKTIIDGYKGSTISSSNYRINNNGNFYYLFNYMIDFEEEIGGLALASIQADETKSVVTPLPFDKLDIKNGTFEFVNDNLVFCGIYKDVVTRKERKEGKTEDVGVYSFFIDGKTSEVKNKGFDYFSKEVKDKLTYRDGKVEESPAKKFYSFENIFTFNGNVYLIESHSYVISGNNSYNSYERELIVSKFNSTGKLEWMRIIPKFTANKLNEFNFLVRNNKVYLFYAEHPKNLEKTTVTEYEPKKYADIKNYNGSVLVCTSFDEKGDLSRSEVFRNEGWCYDPYSINILLDKDNGLMLRMINEAKERYDKISID
jgi:hypothetical protein